MTKKTSTLIPAREDHKSHRSPWLRAAVLGANDGIISTTSIMLGVAASSASRSFVLTAGIASLVAGAMSMAVGEYVSVSSQKDSEKSDLKIEARELKLFEAEERKELEEIYISRGLSAKLAKEVVNELHAYDALGAHARDELGIDQDELSKPFQAAFTSAIAFALGASLPIIATIIFVGPHSSWFIVGGALLTLPVLGAIGALVGGGSKFKAAARVFVGGAAAMAITAAIGKLVGVAI